MRDIDSYKLVEHEKTKQKGIKCLRCGLVSYNPKDIEHLYCGCCHIFHDYSFSDKFIEKHLKFCFVQKKSYLRRAIIFLIIALFYLSFCIINKYIGNKTASFVWAFNTIIVLYVSFRYYRNYRFIYTIIHKLLSIYEQYKRDMASIMKLELTNLKNNKNQLN